MDLNALTAEALSEGRPELVAEFEKVGFEKGKTEGFDAGKTEGLELGKAEGAKAETERLESIDKVAMSGYEDIVDVAKKDGKSTAEDVELAIIRKQRANLSDQSTARATDGANLAAQVAQLNTDPNDDDATAKEAAKKESDKKAGSAMLSGVKTKGE